MAYLQHTSWKDRPGAVIGVIAIHAVIAYALVTGLSFKQLTKDLPRIQSTFVPKVPITPLPPDPVEPKKTEAIPQRPTVAPLPPVDLSDYTPLDTTHIILPPLPIIPRIVPSTTPDVDVGRAFEPIAARPRNDPGIWITTSDYRPIWIRREWTGTARFRLDIAANGRVEGCTITRSSGHAALDQATCELVTRRARFDPARDGAGAKTAGSYASAVRWELPR